MRTLSATLTTNQKASLRPQLCKLVLTKSGQSTQTYDISSTTNRITRLSHPEQEFSQTAYALVDSDTTLAALNLHGYTATISYGYNDVTNGDEYSACAPLEVVGQKTDTLKTMGTLVTGFSCLGVFDMMQYDRASAKYSQDDTNTDTVKTILTAIAEATLVCFSHCKAYTITFDSEDTLIDSFKPADYFSVGFNESRLSAFKRAIGWTKCKARIEDDGEIHVFDPDDGVTHYISGATYNYEYNDAVTNHDFFVKSVRERLVLPSQVSVGSHPSHEPQYAGTASDTATNTALGRYHPEYHYARVLSDTEATAIAVAILQHYQVGAESGHGETYMNCGQEVMDYVKITDSVASDTRTGNIGYLRREYAPGKFNMEFRFGRVTQGVPSGLLGEGDGAVTWEALYALRDWVEKGLLHLWNRERVSKWHIQNVAIAPVYLPKTPVVWTDDPTNVASTTATGNGEIKALGDSDITAHGVCWVTSGTPNTDDDKTDEGAASATGTFTSSITGLSPSTTYYVCAYATNSDGTSYGSLKMFTTGAA